MTQKKTALVTGASGYIGHWLTRCLMKKGYRVRALVRTPEKDSLPHGVEIFQGDLNNYKSLEAVSENMGVIFHLAAKLHINNPGPEQEAEFKRVNIKGTENLVKAVRNSGGGRIIYFSTIGVYGHTERGAICDEDSKLNPETPYAWSKAEGEIIVLENTPSVVLRLGAVYGPGMKGNYPMLMKALKNGLYIHVGDGMNKRTLVHIDDVCSAALAAAENPAGNGRIYNVTDGSIHTMNEIISAMSAALGRKEPKLRLASEVPRLLLKLVNRGFGLVVENPPIGPWIIDKLVEDIAVKGERIVQELGYHPSIGIAEGWKAVARGY